MMIKKHLLAFGLVLPLFLSACGEQEVVSPDHDYTVKGAFGLTIGDKGPNLPEGYLTENKDFTFEPQPAHSFFSEYTFAVTPGSQRIYGIKAKSSNELPRETCKAQRLEYIEQIKKQYPTTPNIKISEEGFKWKLREFNEREIIVDCERSMTPEYLQLITVYQDTNISMLAYKEWREHQVEITKVNKFKP